MIFEVPIDFHPTNNQSASRTPGSMILQRRAEKEVSAAVAETPSVRSFTFSASRQFPPPLKRAFTSPALQVQNLSRKSSSSSRTNSISDLFKSIRLPSTVLQAAVSMQQLA